MFVLHRLYIIYLMNVCLSYDWLNEWMNEWMNVLWLYGWLVGWMFVYGIAYRVSNWMSTLQLFKQISSNNVEVPTKIAERYHWQDSFLTQGTIQVHISITLNGALLRTYNVIGYWNLEIENDRLRQPLDLRVPSLTYGHVIHTF
jgi:hypothetical protein